MNKARRKYDASFKAKVAIEAIRERETLSELSAKYEVSPVMISRWKKEFIDNSAAAFETPKRDDKAMEKQKDRYLRKKWTMPIPNWGIISQQLAIKFVDRYSLL